MGREVSTRPFWSHRLRHLLAEVGVESVGFNGRAGLGRNQEQCPCRVNHLAGCPDGVGEGGIQDNKLRVFWRTAESLPQHLRAKTAAAHAQQHNVAEPVLPDCPGKPLQKRQLAAHDAGDGQPVQPVADFRWFRLPNGMVAGPDAAHHIPTAQDVQLRVNAGQVGCGKGQRGHRRQLRELDAAAS